MSDERDRVDTRSFGFCLIPVRNEKIAMNKSFTAEEQRLIELWERHMRYEFAERDAAATVATMSRENYVNHVPVLTGGRGPEEMLAFYGQHFIPKMPADTQIVPVCRTVGQERVIDEIIFKFTHDTEMDWMLPGVPPTGKRVEVPLVVVVQLSGDEIVCERIYWDQASVLVQLGRLDASALPVTGVESARKVLDPGLPSNELIRRTQSRRINSKTGD
jgi:carboxymethylenebutenolidase